MASFLKNLFTPKWQHTDPKVRLSALDEALEPSILVQLAKNDNDQAVRLKATNLLSDEKTLLELVNDKSEDIKQLAAKQLIAVTLKSEDETQQQTNLAQITDPDVLTVIANYAHNTLAQQAIGQIHDEPTLLAFILQCPSAKNRHLAAQHIQTKNALKEIEHAFLNKDKTLVRLAKQKLTDINQSLEAEQAKQAQIDKLLNDAHELAEHAFSPTYAGQIARLKQSWGLENTTEQQNSKFAADISKCDEKLAENQAIQAKLDEAKAAQQEAQKLQLQALECTQDFFAKCKSSAPELSEINDVIAQVNAIWQHAINLNQPLESQIKKEFEALLKPLINLQASLNYLEKTAIDFKPLHACLENNVLADLQTQQKQLKTTIKSVNWPAEFPTHKTLNSLSTLHNEIENALLDLQKDEKHVLNQLENTLKDMQQAVENGQAKSAKHIQNTIRKQLEKIDPSKAKSYKNSFQSISQSLKELQDWQGFATLPKFQELCSQMESLIDADLAPKERANAIQQLQEKWKSLGSLPSQKQQQALWQTFKQASDKAYEPCQAYFSEMANVRKYNLEQRTIICNELEHYYKINDWESANWKSVQQILDKAHLEFKQFSPVDRTQKKAILDRFHKATQTIHGKLVEHYKHNAQQKQTLIDDVTALHELDDINQAIEACKHIQEQWKTKGNAGRAERQLWQTFREQCDNLFEKRQAISQARKHQFDQNIQQANLLVDQLTANTSNSIKATKDQLSAVQQQISALELPKKIKLGIDKRLSDFNQYLDKARSDEKRIAQHNLWLNAQNVAQQLSQAEQSGEMDAQFKDSLLTANIPQNVRAIFNKRLSEQPKTGAQETFAQLCLELEILLDAPSPEQDQAQRMALQVARLQKNMGQKLPTLEEQLRELQCRWFALPANETDYPSLHDRFFDTLNKRYETQAED